MFPTSTFNLLVNSWLNPQPTRLLMGWLCSYCLAWWLYSRWRVYYCCPEAKCKMCWFKTVVRHGSCVKFNFKSLTPKRSMSQQTGCTRYSFVQLDPVERVLGFNACQRCLRDMYDNFFKLSVLFLMGYWNYLDIILQMHIYK